MTPPRVILTLALTLLLGLARSVAPADTVTITSKQAVVRAGPDSKQAVLTTVAQGTTFALLETRQGWYRVLLDDGREGWVAQSVVKLERGLVRPNAPPPPPRSDPAGHLSAELGGDCRGQSLPGRTHCPAELCDQ
jgi:SH3 domain-containing protein